MLLHFSWKPIFWRAQLIYIWTYYTPSLPQAPNFCYPLTLIIWWKFYAELLASILQLEFEIFKGKQILPQNVILIFRAHILVDSVSKKCIQVLLQFTQSDNAIFYFCNFNSSSNDLLTRIGKKRFTCFFFFAYLE